MRPTGSASAEAFGRGFPRFAGSAGQLGGGRTSYAEKMRLRIAWLLATTCACTTVYTVRAGGGAATPGPAPAGQVIMGGGLEHSLAWEVGVVDDARGPGARLGGAVYQPTDGLEPAR